MAFIYWFPRLKVYLIPCRASKKMYRGEMFDAVALGIIANSILKNY
jgi:hypothetical protein